MFQLVNSMNGLQLRGQGRTPWWNPGDDRRWPLLVAPTIEDLYQQIEMVGQQKDQHNQTNTKHTCHVVIFMRFHYIVVEPQITCRTKHIFVLVHTNFDFWQVGLDLMDSPFQFTPPCNHQCVIMFLFNHALIRRLITLMIIYGTHSKIVPITDPWWLITIWAM